MATQTPLVHPALMAQTEQFYPYRATFTRYNPAGARVPIDAMASIPAAYTPAAGGEPGTFQVEASTNDRVLLQGWYPQIRKGWEFGLYFEDETLLKYFSVSDVMPLDSSHSGTLLTVKPA